MKISLEHRYVVRPAPNMYGPVTPVFLWKNWNLRTGESVEYRFERMKSGLTILPEWSPFAPCRAQADARDGAMPHRKQVWSPRRQLIGPEPPWRASGQLKDKILWLSGNLCNGCNIFVTAALSLYTLLSYVLPSSQDHQFHEPRAKPPRDTLLSLHNFQAFRTADWSQLHRLATYRTIKQRVTTFYTRQLRWNGELGPDKIYEQRTTF